MKTVCFGELLLRFKTPGYERFLQTPRFDTSFCGSEINVAVDLAIWGQKTSFVTAFPQNALGDAALREIKSWNVETSHILRMEGRLGELFLETGSNQRASQVIYDREYSSFSKILPNTIDWKSVFQDVNWFHISGITPALSQSLAEVVLEGMRVARNSGVTISCDINYRSSLWKYGIEPLVVMREIVSMTDVLIGNEEDIQKALKIGEDIEPTKEIDFNRYKSLTDSVLSNYPNLKLVANTLRDSYSADYNVWSGCINTRENFYQSLSYKITDIVDRVGSGDCFAAGIIYGILQNWKMQEVLDFAVAASCLKHSVPGDFARIDLKEINKLMRGESSGRVVR